MTGYSLHIDASGNVIATSAAGNVLYTGPVTELPSHLRPAANTSTSAPTKPAASDDVPATSENLRDVAAHVAREVAKIEAGEKVPALVRTPVAGLLKLMHNVLLISAEKAGTPDGGEGFPRFTVIPSDRAASPSSSTPSGEEEEGLVVKTDALGIRFKSGSDLLRAVAMAWDMPYAPAAAAAAARAAGVAGEAV
ncbi:hypothetical protein BC828DRAFT_399121 [Blastocladiella britannica]|nr:hypothetical protein BC828DRAFT_399121 [Blastocladiella britannica]